MIKHILIIIFAISLFDSSLLCSEKTKEKTMKQLLEQHISMMQKYYQIKKDVDANKNNEELYLKAKFAQQDIYDMNRKISRQFKRFFISDKEIQSKIFWSITPYNSRGSSYYYLTAYDINENRIFSISIYNLKNPSEKFGMGFYKDKFKGYPAFIKDRGIDSIIVNQLHIRLDNSFNKLKPDNIIEFFNSFDLKGLEKIGSGEVPIEKEDIFKASEIVINKIKILKNSSLTQTNNTEKQRTIFNAISLDDLSMMKRFLIKDPSLLDFKRKRDGRTPLRAAASSGRVEIVKFLLKKGADINANGDSILSSAADGTPAKWKKKLKIAKILVEAGIKTNNSAIIEAARREFLEMVKFLLDNGADPNFVDNRTTPAYAAAETGNVKIMTLLLDSGAKFSVPESLITKETPLHIAAKFNKSEMVDFLIKNGIDVNSKAIYNNTPLHSAIGTHKDCLETIKILIKNKADLSLKGRSKNTPLHIAVINKKPGVAKLLLENGAPLDIKNRKGQTPVDIVESNDEYKKIMKDVFVQHLGKEGYENILKSKNDKTLAKTNIVGRWKSTKSNKALIFKESGQVVTNYSKSKARRWEHLEGNEYYFYDTKGKQSTLVIDGYKISFKGKNQSYIKQYTGNNEYPVVSRKPFSTDGKIIIWNTNNGGSGNSGIKEFNIQLKNKGKVVWSKNNIEIEWAKKGDFSTSISFPKKTFDSVRVEVTKSAASHAGFQELQLFKGSDTEKNYALNCVAKASNSQRSPNNHDFGPYKITDGITSSSKGAVGLWIMPKKKLGWIEVDLTKVIQK
jgi:ankyrin repeat protein